MSARIYNTGIPTLVEGKEMPIEENSLTDLFNSCNINNSITNQESDLSSEDGEDYGDDETILSMATSRRSILVSEGTKSHTPLLPTKPTPLDEKFWCEPDGNTFKVRTKSYMKQKAKKLSEQSLFRLFAVDMVEVEKPIMTGMCAHPDERVQQCLKAQMEGRPGCEMPPFIFCINLVVPGTPIFHVAFYYAVDDMSLINPKSLDPDSGVTSPNPEFTSLATEFFFGSSDKFRDKTFKLIPRIAKGNFVVKSAVGTKPALIGTKVKQHYLQSEKFFEVIVDISSDPIAKKIVGLSRSYAETLVVDIAFLLEGKSLETLPEQVMGTVRLSNLDFKAKHRLLKHIS